MNPLLPSDAHTQCHTGIGAERDKLLAGLAQDVVHADEEVVTLRMDVEHVTQTGGKSRGTTAGIAFILQIDVVGQLVTVIIPLVVDSASTFISHGNITESTKSKSLTAVDSLHVVFPTDKAKVQDCETQL